MREDILNQIEEEFAQIRTENERTETRRKEEIRMEQPEIQALVRERESLVFDTLRGIVNRTSSGTGNLTERMASLSAEIRKKLKEKGYPEDYLAPIYSCSACRDTGRTGDPVREPCICLKRAYRKKIREMTGLDLKPAETFETFDPEVFPCEKMPGKNYSQREQMLVIRDFCAEWAERFPDVDCRDILISGASGLGKTFLLHSMAEKLIERDRDVTVLSAYRLIDTLRSEYFNHDGSASGIPEAKVLMIDDLGSEPLMQNVTVEQLFTLLNERQSRGLSTIISTNLNLLEFRNRYTERIASRMMDRRSSKVFAIEGKDIRTGGARRK